MNQDKFIRSILWATAVFNLAGALLIAFPSSSLGQFVGLPVPVPPIYTTLLAFFVILFGGVYAWLARQPKIDRPLVAFSAIGKAGAFTVFFVCWFFGELSFRGVAAATGDLIFAGLFSSWLISTRHDARVDQQRTAATAG